MNTYYIIHELKLYIYNSRVWSYQRLREDFSGRILIEKIICLLLNILWFPPSTQLSSIIAYSKFEEVVIHIEKWFQESERPKRLGGRGGRVLE